MSGEAKKYTLQQVEALELAPGTERQKLAGWVPSLASEEELRAALDKALDYRGDVAITLKSGERIDAYIFNRLSGATLAESRVQYFTPLAPEKRSLSYAEIAGLEFSAKDPAEGKRWEDWVRHYEERRAAGERNIGLKPESLD
jgi:hypothetical protein